MRGLRGAASLGLMVAAPAVITPAAVEVGVRAEMIDLRAASQASVDAARMAGQRNASLLNFLALARQVAAADQAEAIALAGLVAAAGPAGGSFTATLAEVRARVGATGAAEETYAAAVGRAIGNDLADLARTRGFRSAGVIPTELPLARLDGGAACRIAIDAAPGLAVPPWQTLGPVGAARAATYQPWGPGAFATTVTAWSATCRAEGVIPGLALVDPPDETVQIALVERPRGAALTPFRIVATEGGGTASYTSVLLPGLAADASLDWRVVLAP